RTAQPQVGQRLMRGPITAEAAVFGNQGALHGVHHTNGAPPGQSRLAIYAGCHPTAPSCGAMGSRSGILWYLSGMLRLLHTRTAAAWLQLHFEVRCDSCVPARRPFRPG